MEVKRKAKQQDKRRGKYIVHSATFDECSGGSIMSAFDACNARQAIVRFLFWLGVSRNAILPFFAANICALFRAARSRSVVRGPPCAAEPTNAHRSDLESLSASALRWKYEPSARDARSD